MFFPFENSDLAIYDPICISAEAVTHQSDQFRGRTEKDVTFTSTSDSVFMTSQCITTET